VLLVLRGGAASMPALVALIVPQFFLTCGLCWILAATGVYVRDLGQITGFLLTLWFFLTPICYPEAQLSPDLARWLKWNPMSALVSGYRDILLEHRMPSARVVLALWAVSIASAGFGYAWFQKLRKRFAEIV